MLQYAWKIDLRGHPMESPASGPTELPLTGWRPPWWHRSWQMPKLASGRYTGAGLVALVLFLAAWLRLSHLGEFENLYYTATVKSMLSSAHNFLFASFDPGGVVMVDKPPFGFWVDAIPASIFGVNSTSVSVLHGVAGVVSVGLLYLLLRPVFGMTAALVAALTLAVVPASVFVDSRNELDSLVVFELLAAAWCLVRAVQGRHRWWLLAWAALMGIAFNTKMLVAFVPLPAFILYYLLASDGRWRARLAWTGAALLLLSAVSLSWVTLVAVTPADQRPYVGSTQDNSIWTLAFKYNALNRFVGGIGPRPQPPGGAPGAPLQTGRPGTGALPPTAGQPGPSGPTAALPGQPPGSGLLPPPPGPPPGDNSIMNLFTERLAVQLGGLLFLAIIKFAVAAIRLVPSRVYRHPRSFLAVASAPRNGQIVLWGSWLVTGILVFGLSAATVTHPYYLSELTPPVAAALGIGSASVWRAYRLRKGLGYILAAFLLAGAAYELYVFRATAGIWAQSLVIVAGVTATWLLAIAWLRSLTRSPLTGAAAIAGAIAVLWLPLVASWNRDVASSPMPPRPGPPPGLAAPAGAPPFGPPPGGPPSPQRDPRLVDAVERYIQAEEGTSAMSGIAAVRASEVAPFIVRGMPAVAIGGFSGSDPIFTLESFQEFVRSGKVGHFLLGAGPPGAPPTQARQPVIQWVQRT
ncbi:MAG: glycosyltransferase family 39 protein, partial [Chloroflexi bacterium]|nr:glycosyltransferase family 39 protein [Chloroflexota bacterium]